MGLGAASHPATHNISKSCKQVCKML